MNNQICLIKFFPKNRANLENLRKILNEITFSSLYAKCHYIRHFEDVMGFYIEFKDNMTPSSDENKSLDKEIDKIKSNKDELTKETFTTLTNKTLRRQSKNLDFVRVTSKNGNEKSQLVIR